MWLRTLTVSSYSCVSGVVKKPAWISTQRIPFSPKWRARGSVIAEMAPIDAQYPIMTADPFVAAKLDVNEGRLVDCFFSLLIYLDRLMITPRSPSAEGGLFAISRAAIRARL